MHLECVRYLNEATMEKLILGSRVLEDLTIMRYPFDNPCVFQVSSQTLKRIHVDAFNQVIIDAPLLQSLKSEIFKEKKFNIISLSFPAKVEIDLIFDWFDPYRISYRSVVPDIITDISKVRDLVIGGVMWKEIYLYSKVKPLLQFHYLTLLNATYFISDLELLPTLLQSCPNLESLILEVYDDFISPTEEEEPNVMFSTVPRCLVSSLKFVELKRSTLVSEYEGEMELVRYFLKNSVILEKLRLDNYYTEKEKDDILAMPRCSSACQVLIR